MKKLYAVVLVICLPLCCMLIGAHLFSTYGYLLFPGYAPVPASAIKSTLAPTKLAGPVTKTVKVLFLGNSFTFENNLPMMVAQIAASDPTNTVEIDAHAVTMGGVHLMDIWKSTDAYRVLTAEHWDYVVLQEYSSWTAKQEYLSETSGALNQWIWAASQVSAKPLFFENWADSDESHVYHDYHYVFYGQSFHQAQQGIITQTENLAHVFKMDVVPVGRYWAYVHDHPGTPDLYDADHHHPGAAGTFLAALLFYHYFTGNQVDHVTYLPGTMTREQAKAMIDLFPQVPLR